MKASFPFLFLIALLLALPLMLREAPPAVVNADTTVVIITPHPESTRAEFAEGFARWYREKTGRSVYVDYRVIGGTSEIARFLQSEFTNAFRNYWTRELGRPWNREIQDAFANHRIVPAEEPSADTLAQSARRAFLASNVGAGIDLFFGGGVYDFSNQARRGHLIDSGFLQRFPDWFTESAQPGAIPPAIPRLFAGETFYDAEGRWYGACLSSYGIIFNRPALRNLGIEREPSQWVDLADPRLFGQIAVCDPTKSGSMTQAFEMIIQQQMQQRLQELKQEHPDRGSAELEHQAIREGWLLGMRLIQVISANARYFTDSSQKPNIDVAMGDCAVGMSIDFYGRFQQDNVRERGGGDRMGMNIPAGGSTISVDPIGMFRGARNPDTALMFMEYVLSLEGQKLWNLPVGVQGGPRTYALRRLPVQPELYLEPWDTLRSDADYNPYHAAADFYYHSEWTGHLFSELRTLIRIAFIDTRTELVAAWGAILQAHEEGRLEDANRAYSIMAKLEMIEYDIVQTDIRSAIRSSPLNEVRLARELGQDFRTRYRQAERIAKGL